METEKIMQEFMILQQCLEEAERPGKIFMGKGGYSIMLDGNELEENTKTGETGRNPAMLLLSVLSDSKGKTEYLLSVTQTIYYGADKEDKISDWLNEWQSNIYSLGVIPDHSKRTLLLKSTFPLAEGTEGLSPAVLGETIDSFRREADML